jgi:hypothetical protein
MFLALLATYRVKNETQHQLIWVLIFLIEAGLLTAHQMAWRNSFSAEITQAMLPHVKNDPTALFYLVETGWWVDLCSSDVCCCYNAPLVQVPYHCLIFRNDLTSATTALPGSHDVHQLCGVSICGNHVAEPSVVDIDHNEDLCVSHQLRV